MRGNGISLGLLFCLVATGVSAQVRDDVEIRVSSYTLTANGPEKPANATLSSWPTTTGKAKSGAFSVGGCGDVSVRFDPEFATFHKSAIAGWLVEVTPIKVIDHTVTFRLRWNRPMDKGVTGTPREDIELTLRPGESRPIDTVSIPASATASDGRPCAAKAASLRVSVDFPDWDSRLFGADLWLVERLADGTERSQLQAVRGIPYRAIPFYFERIGDVDLFGHITIEPSSSGSAFAVEIVRAQVDVPPPVDTHGYQAARWDRSTAQVKAEEVIEVPLPQLEDRFGPYAKRNFALRIKARRIR